MKYISILIAVLIFLLGYILLWNNEDFYLNIAASDSDSKAAQYSIKRVLAISMKKDLVSKFSEKIEKNQNENLHFLYLLIMGITGDGKASHRLISSYIECQDSPSSPKCMTMQYFSVTGLGLLGVDQNAKILKPILSKYDQHRTEVRGQIFARSIYLMTGEKVKYKNSNGEIKKFEPWERIENARNIIISTKNRRRSLDEMLILYNAV